MFRFGLGIRRVVTQAFQSVLAPIPEIIHTQSIAPRKQVKQDITFEFESIGAVISVEPAIALSYESQSSVITIENDGLIAE